MVEGFWSKKYSFERWKMELERPKAIQDVVRTVMRNIRGTSGCIRRLV
jgi:hypothetical protein